jgi:hypothetical protein
MGETRSIPGHNLDNMGECSGTLFMDLDADDILTVDLTEWWLQLTRDGFNLRPFLIFF